MDFFQRLAQIAPGMKLIITAMEKNGTYAISVLPDTVHKLEPIMLSGTPAEIDGGIIEWLEKPLSQVKTFIDTNGLEKSIVDAVKKTETSKPDTKIKKTVEPKEKAPPKQEEPKPKEAGADTSKDKNKPTVLTLL